LLCRTIQKAAIVASCLMEYTLLHLPAWVLQLSVCDNLCSDFTIRSSARDSH